MAAHQSGKCQRATEIIPVASEDILKGRALDKRGLNWEQIYRILFPEGDIPSPCKATKGIGFWQRFLIAFKQIGRNPKSQRLITLMSLKHTLP